MYEFIQNALLTLNQSLPAASTLAWVAAAAMLAGFVDAVVGGGGLVLVPALFTVFPNTPVVTLLASNKVASSLGTASAAWQFARRIPVVWGLVLPAMAAAGLAAILGAWTVTVVPNDILRKILPVVLLGLLIYTVFKPTLGQEKLQNQEQDAVLPLQWSGLRGRAAMIVGAGLIGFYDGFFGPGTGSLLVFGLVAIWGYGFVHASATAKLINLSCNFGALVWFVPQGHVWWVIAAWMAVFNIAGAVLGASMAQRLGAGFIRRVFIVVVTALLCKTSWSAYFA